MKYFIAVLIFVCLSKTNAFILHTPLIAELNENLTIPCLGPQRIYVKGVASNPGFDVDIFDVRSNVWGEFNVILSLNYRTADRTMTLSSYVRSDKFCFEPNCVLGWHFDSMLDIPITVGNSFELSLITDSNFYQVFIDGKFITNYRHRVALKHASILNIRNGISILKLDINRLQLT